MDLKTGFRPSRPFLALSWLLGIHPADRRLGQAQGATEQVELPNALLESLDQGGAQRRCGQTVVVGSCASFSLAQCCLLAILAPQYSPRHVLSVEAIIVVRLRLSTATCLRRCSIQFCAPRRPAPIKERSQTRTGRANSLVCFWCAFQNGPSAQLALLGTSWPYMFLYRLAETGQFWRSSGRIIFRKCMKTWGEGVGCGGRI